MPVNIHPVGTFYTQYSIVGVEGIENMFPENESPAALFGGTWTDMYLENVFFRTGPDLGQRRGKYWYEDWEDGFNGFWTDLGGVPGLEPDAIREFYGRINNIVGTYDTTSEGAFLTEFINASASPVGSGQRRCSFEFGTYFATPTDNTNHPRNRLIKVWKKTAN